jgi:biopolymer transport protein ExbD
MKTRAIAHEPVNMGFQIAPMIDVVFVIMLFFMVMSASLRKEVQLGFALPGKPTLFVSDSLEIVIGIEEDGVITMNEEEYDSPALKHLPALTASLTRLARDQKELGYEVLVTVQAEERVRYQRIVDVLNATSKAGFRNVTVAVGEE